MNIMFLEKEKEKEFLRRLGFKDYLIFKIIGNLELLINLPYIILRTIVTIFYCIFDFLDDIFSKKLLIYFIEFKPIRKYSDYIIQKLKTADYKIKKEDLKKWN